MEILRTPDERFDALVGYDFEPNYLMVKTPDGPMLRMHYVDAGDPDAPVVLLLHGEPAWSYLYRKMIAPITQAGFRVIAPDLIGFGRSDKPAAVEDYTYERHVDWVRQFVACLDVGHVHMVCQDWGGLIGMSLVTQMFEQFDRIVAANTFLPDGTRPLSDGFLRWREFSQRLDPFDAGQVVQLGTVTDLAPEVVDAYRAPFFDQKFTAGARIFPMLVPTSPDDPASEPMRRAWDALGTWERPFLTVFGDSDPIMRGSDQILQAHVPGAEGQPHTTLKGAGHFLQEDRGEELAQIVVEFLKG